MHAAEIKLCLGRLKHKFYGRVSWQLYVIRSDGYTLIVRTIALNCERLIDSFRRVPLLHPSFESIYIRSSITFIFNKDSYQLPINYVIV